MLQYAVPTACAQAFLNGAIGVRLLDAAQWVDAYPNNLEMSSIIRLVCNPGTITNKGLTDANLNANYRSALRQSHIFLEDGILFYREQLAGSESFVRLQLVPAKFRNIVFIALYSNPIGGHFNAYRTFHRI